MEKGITRSPDGIPRYDGTPELLAAYREEAVQYLMTFEHKKRYVVGPRLLKELEGTAKIAVRPMTLRDPQWVSKPRGVYILLDYLESVVARPSLPEASRFVMKFFYGMQRRRGETMTSWITRHQEGLWEASQALRKVQKEHGKKTEPTMWGVARPSSDVGTRSQTSGEQEQAQPFRDDGRLFEEEEEENEYHGWHRWWHNHSEWSEDSWRSKEYEPPSSWDTSSEIFIPEFLAGFLLLHRSGLDAHERANVMAAIRGEFSVVTVSRALREQWGDDDLQKRDRLKSGAAAMWAEEEGDSELQALVAEGDLADYDNMSPEDRQAYMAEEAKVEDALAAIQNQKATLKEARWKQKQIRLGRGYFPPKPFPRGGDATSSKSSSGTKLCFRCGGPHLVANCPKPAQQAKVASEEAAEIAFGACEMGKEEQNFFGKKAEDGFMVEETVNRCYGVIDSGATSSLASVDALEQVMKANVASHGETRMEVNPDNRPTFRFGNGARKDCMSTVTLGLGAGDKTGRLEVHVHDSPGQPILISRKALKALGAVLDFRTGEVIYTKVNAHRVVKLEEASNGHLLMPMTGNLLSEGVDRPTPFVSLHE